MLSALNILRVPDVFILILGMTYRYIYLLLRVANDMFLSRKSRMVGHMGTSDNQKMLAAISGTLLNKSLNMSSEVYLAMQSRGFRGSIVTLKAISNAYERLDLVIRLLLSSPCMALFLGRLMLDKEKP